MLRIIVELHSARTGQKKQIGLLDIANTGTGTEARDVALAAVVGLGLYFLFNKTKRL